MLKYAIMSTAITNTNNSGTISKVNRLDIIINMVKRVPKVTPEYPPNKAESPLVSVMVVVTKIMIKDATMTANGIFSKKLDGSIVCFIVSMDYLFFSGFQVFRFSGFRAFVPSICLFLAALLASALATRVPTPHN